MKLDWDRHRMSNEGSSLATFDIWLFNVAMCATMVKPYETPLADNEKKSSTKTTRERIFVHNAVDSPEGSQQQRSQQEQERVSCEKCAGNHRLSDCDDFRSMGTNQRWEIVKEKRLCFCCFLRHRAQHCKSKKKCHIDGCESTHHVLLHTPTMSGSKVEHTGKGSNHRIKESESAVMFHGSSATNLDLPEQSIGPQLLKSRKHLSTLPILQYNNVKAQLIIGLDNIKITAPLEIREGENDDVIAALSRLGWAVYGRPIVGDSTTPRLLHICQCSAARRMDDALKNHFSIESSGVSVSSHPLRSKEDERSMQIMEATKTYLEDEKRWQTGQLWRFDRMHLPDSYQMAVKRLKCLEAKMSKDPPLKEFMMNTMHDYKQKGYIRRLNNQSEQEKDAPGLGCGCQSKWHVAVKAICENTFVDDWLQSVDTRPEMIHLAETVKRIHASGGFLMRRWTSNSKQVIQALEDDCEELDKRISAQDEAQEKVLGLWWLPGHDLLTFVVTPNLLAKASKERPTKRRVLSIILENIWRSDIGWDDDLTNEDEADWQHWLDLVSNLNAVHIPRCMKWAELDGQVHCSLVASKTRVAPLKPVSIPRMELMAAVLGLRLAKCFQKEMSFQQFVALRIGEILEESDVDSWRWVPSAKNVADDGTKWTKTPEIHGSTRWFKGPQFLYLEESQWQKSEIGPALNMLYHAKEQPNHTSSWRCILPDLQRFSKLEKLRAAQLYVLDFLRNITKKVRLDGGLDLQKTLLLKRSNEMDVIFIRICQEEEFKVRSPA
ncbi:uncharacterized protein [Drosophila virilis]|uniref:uncharacterized protein n=1 Tax=Drosophila virilis TaxID=7244 RepID=UPI0038B37642